MQLSEATPANTPYPALETVREGFPASVVSDWLRSADNLWVRDWTESISPNEIVVSGTLHFACAYNRASGKIDMFSGEGIGEQVKRRPFFVEDAFQVRINFPADSIPEIWETEKRIARLAKQRRTISYNLHTKPNGSCCLAYHQELRGLTTDAAGLRNYIAEFVIPFFYSRSGEERNMKIPGWGEYGHGILGLLEYYYEKGEDMSDDEFQHVLQDMFQNTRSFQKRVGGSHKHNPRLWWRVVGSKKIKPGHTYYRDNFTNGSKKKFLLPRKCCLALKMMAERRKGAITSS